MLHRLRYWLRAALRYDALEREMREEMQRHLDQRVETLIASGLSSREARLAARREFGNPAVHQDDGRDARGTRWIESLLSDVRFAFRHFARTPLASVTIVLVLALGIGGHAFQLSLLAALTRRPPPGIPTNIPLVRLRGTYKASDAPEWHHRSLWYTEVEQARALPNVFTTVAAWTMSTVVTDVRGKMNGETVRAQFVTDGFFHTIGVPITHGPGFARGGDARLDAVISDAMWDDVFDRREVAGQTMMVDGLTVRIVGVAPRGFMGAEPADDRRIMWLPLAAREAIVSAAGPTPYSALDSASFQAVGLLRPGVSVQTAAAAAHAIARRAAARMVPPPSPGARIVYAYDADVVRLRGLTQPDDSDMPTIVTVWGALTLLVLLVVCTNVGGLMMNTADARTQEVAVRLSLGASRARVVRQLLTESVLLGVIGGILGLIVFEAIVAAASHVPEVEYVRPDMRTLATTMLVAAGTGMVFGLAPALHATRSGISEVLKGAGSGATRRSRIHRVFVVGQVMLTQPLLVLIAALIWQIRAADPIALPNGVPDHVLRMSLDMTGVPGSNGVKSGALRRVAQRLADVPGVATIVPEPSLLAAATLNVRKEDRGALAAANEPIQVDMMLSAPGYFSMLGVPLLRGDDLPPTTDTSWTTVIGSDLARRLWGTADPIGRRFRQISPAPRVDRDIIVTGVYDSQHLPAHAEGGRIAIFRAVRAWWASPYSIRTALIRTSVPAVAMADTLRQVAHAELPSTPIERPLTLAQIATRESQSADAARLGAAASAALALLLASMGLYGIVALSVGQRRREIGIRMALGARGAAVVALFYRSGILLGALGLALGLPISLIAAHYLPIVQRNGGITDPYAPNLAALGAVVGTVVLIVASIATLIPASRAARVDPVTALRAE